MKIVCIGSGNVATHFANAFKAGAAELVQIWSKNQDHAAELALATGAEPISDLKEIDPEADLYLIAVKDDAIPEVIKALADVKGMVVHTSGATDIGVFHETGMNYGGFISVADFFQTKSAGF
jgi:predicted short-subunit dehydrogenase-like oxidoreductase (DUF2520 family)